MAQLHPRVLLPQEESDTVRPHVTRQAVLTGRSDGLPRTPVRRDDGLHRAGQDLEVPGVARALPPARRASPETLWSHEVVLAAAGRRVG